MKRILENIPNRYDITIQEIEVMPDYIHMLLSFNPKHAPNSIVKTLEERSVREWFQLFPESKQQLWNGHLWSPSFFMSTLGNMSKDVVAQHIQNQLTEFNAGRSRQ